MGLLSFLFGRTPPKPLPIVSPKEVGQLIIDLSRFSIGASKLGATPAAKDFFAEPLLHADTYDAPEHGLEIGMEKGVVDSVFINLDKFPGQFARDGAKISLTTNTTEKEILKLFRDPYWVDRSDGKIILFYEPEEGAIEIQFEFPSSQRLVSICMMRHGVLSSLKHREAYGVTKVWPPDNLFQQEAMDEEPTQISVRQRTNPDFLNAVTQAIQAATSGTPGTCLTFTSIGESHIWVQFLNGELNAPYSFSNQPEQVIAELLDRSVIKQVNDFQPNSSISLDVSGSPPHEVAQWIEDYFINVLQCTDDFTADLNIEQFDTPPNK